MKFPINFKYIVFISFLILTQTNNSQTEHEIKGKIIDKETGKAIVNCNVAIVNTNQGTLSNDKGEFVLKTREKDSIQVIFSHESYEKQQLQKLNYSNLIIEMIRLPDNDIQTAMMQLDINGDPLIKKLHEELTSYSAFNLIEKVYLHIDKKTFIPEEEIWYSAYVTMRQEKLYTDKSNVLHIDLIDSNGNIMISQTQELVKGRGKGSMTIPKNVASGKYQLRAYTNWMRNYDHAFFYNELIEIINNIEEEKINEITDKIDLQFFPEGGDAIIGLNNKITFKAIGADGLNRTVKGKILDSKKNAVAYINTLHKGLGFFNLQPVEGEIYIAELENGLIYDLPKFKTEGYTMSVDNTFEDAIGIKIQASESFKNKPFYVIGTIGNEKLYQGRFKLNNEPSIAFVISKSIFPTGVVTLTLFDYKMKPVSERVVFINNKQNLIIDTKINKSIFNKREEVELDIKVTDAYNRPVATNLSIAITDKEKVEKSINSSNIVTSLFLQSDIKGYIEDVGSYFKEDNKPTRAKLDLVMLTHGWRKFDWNHIKINEIKNFDFETDLEVSGIAKGIDNKPLKKKTLKIIANTQGDLGFYEVLTQDDGKFKIENFTYNDSTEVTINAFRKNGNQMPAKIELFNDYKPEKVSHAENRFKNFKIKPKTALEKDYVYFSKLQQEADLEYVELNEVVIKANSNRGVKEGINSTPSTFGIEPDAVVYGKDYIGFSISTIFSRLPGVLATAGNPPTVTIRRNIGSSVNSATGPLWILDGTPLSTEGGVTIPLEIQTLNSLEIERVEVLKTAQASIFGVRGGNGVILVYTRRGGGAFDGQVASFKDKILMFSGSKKFYSPKYDVELPEHKKPDYRTTLYWNPSIRTDENGKATVTFYNSDITEQIQVDIQALSDYGIPGAYLETFGKKK